jgi:hypothetical protein
MSVCMFLQADTNSSDTHRCAQRIVTFPSSFEAPQAKVASPGRVESIHALHAKARARMLMLAQGCESSRLLLTRV